MDNCYQNFVEGSNGCDKGNPNDRPASATDFKEIKENNGKVRFYLNGEDENCNELQTSVETNGEYFVNQKQLDSNGINFDLKNTTENGISVNNNFSGCKMCFKLNTSDQYPFLLDFNDKFYPF